MKIRKAALVPKVAKSKRKHPKSEDFRCCSGAAGRIRTADLILTKDALYLLSYSSILNSFLIIPIQSPIVKPEFWFF